MTKWWTNQYEKFNKDFVLFLNHGFGKCEFHTNETLKAFKTGDRLYYVVFDVPLTRKGRVYK